MVERIHTTRSEEYPWGTRCYGCERMNDVRHDLLGEEVVCIYCGATLTVSGVSEYPSAIPGESADRPRYGEAGSASAEKTVGGRYRWSTPKIYVKEARTGRSGDRRSSSF